MDEYLDDSDVIVIYRAMLAMIVYYSMRTISVLIEVELEDQGLIPSLPLEPIFVATRRP